MWGNGGGWWGDGGGWHFPPPYPRPHTPQVRPTRGASHAHRYHGGGWWFHPCGKSGRLARRLPHALQCHMSVWAPQLTMFACAHCAPQIASRSPRLPPCPASEGRPVPLLLATPWATRALAKSIHHVVSSNLLHTRSMMRTVSLELHVPHSQPVCLCSILLRPILERSRWSPRSPAPVRRVLDRPARCLTSSSFLVRHSSRPRALRRPAWGLPALPLQASFAVPPMALWLWRFSGAPIGAFPWLFSAARAVCLVLKKMSPSAFRGSSGSSDRHLLLCLDFPFLSLFFHRSSSPALHRRLLASWMRQLRLPVLKTSGGVQMAHLLLLA